MIWLYSGVLVTARADAVLMLNLGEFEVEEERITVIKLGVCHSGSNNGDLPRLFPPPPPHICFSISVRNLGVTLSRELPFRNDQSVELSSDVFLKADELDDIIKGSSVWSKS